MNRHVLNWNGNTIDFAQVAAFDGRMGDTDVTVIFADGSEKRLTSYPGEGLFQRIRAYYVASRILREI